MKIAIKTPKASTYETEIKILNSVFRLTTEELFSNPVKVGKQFSDA